MTIKNCVSTQARLSSWSQLWRWCSRSRICHKPHLLLSLAAVWFFLNPSSLVSHLWSNLILPILKLSLTLKLSRKLTSRCTTFATWLQNFAELNAASRSRPAQISGPIIISTFLTSLSASTAVLTVTQSLSLITSRTFAWTPSCSLRSGVLEVKSTKLQEESMILTCRSWSMERMFKKNTRLMLSPARNLWDYPINWALILLPCLIWLTFLNKIYG